MSKKRAHHSHEKALKNFAAAVAHAADIQAKNRKNKVETASRRLKYENRLDEYVDKTIERYELLKKRSYHTYYFVMHDRDNKKWVIVRKINRKEDISFGSMYRRETEELMWLLKEEKITWEEALDMETKSYA